MTTELRTSAGTPVSGSAQHGWRIPKSLRAWLRVKIVAGGLILVVLVLMGAMAPWISPFDPNKQDLSGSMQVPQWFGGVHFLGTDQLGRDTLSRIYYGSRISLVIGVTVAIISGIIGVGLGAVSGYFGGKIDFIIQKSVEVVWAFPPLLLAIAVMAFFGQSLGLLIFALVLQRWIPFCRVTRGQALSLRSRDYVDAARALGASDMRILLKHILPNLMQTAIVIGTFAMATAIISEASLSFLGLGVPREIPSWGGMLSDARAYISTSWWLPLFPGLAILFTVLGINLVGDGMRDMLDPKLKRSGRRSDDP